LNLKKGTPSKRHLSIGNYAKDDYVRNETSQRFSNINAPPRITPTTRYANLFHGYCFSCHNFGHKAINYRSNTGYNYLRSIYNTTGNDYLCNKTSHEFAEKNYNSFSLLMNSNVECYKCINYGHKSHECRNILKYIGKNMKQKSYTNNKEGNTRVWKKKLDQQKGEENNLALHAQNNIIQWYIDSGCSKNMSIDHNIFRKTKVCNFMFGNHNSSKIIGKGTISIVSEKAKLEIMFLIEDMKHSLLNVIQIYDQGHILALNS
jgi:hypothetical protein